MQYIRKKKTRSLAVAVTADRTA